ncbi:uncharacterized protein LOC101173523 [Oryzias latipes]|uniref:uncharacterized protein LOC101173523 n=1 Tax=Oryzias latipes TaxID=8090 RepID=UPI0000EA1DC4|nr:uncharacterized protein LOC101173523 [Oryzias latipes]XP_011491516.1 uncharacterized protein LOC101173523 [Oryzias latipes]
MEEKLIIAVCARPELYDTKLVMYRDRAVRKKTWCSVSEEVGLPPDQCRKRWKSLRDLYMREKRKEMQRRNRPEGGPCKRWKYSAVPSFLDPFFSPREMNGNMDASSEDNMVEYDPQAEAATASSAMNDFSEPASPFSDQDSLLGPATASSSPSSARARSSSPGPSTFTGHFSSPGPSAAAGQPVSPGPSTAAEPTRSRKKRKRSWDEHVDFEREILRALQAEPQPLPPPPPLSETELFLKSLIPMIDRLPPMRKGALKLKIHSLVFEAVSEFM